MDLVDPRNRTDQNIDETSSEVGIRRGLDGVFTWASLLAIALTGVPFMWILWSDWGPIDPVRRALSTRTTSTT